MAEWNAGSGQAWNRLRTALARHVDLRLEFWRAVEVQDRGALHHHAVIWSPIPLDPHAVQAYAIAAGYGCVFDIREARSARDLARYVSKYVTKGDDRSRALWLHEVVNRDTGELEQRTEATYRTHSQSHGWGATLKGLRDLARLQARARAEQLRELATAADSGQRQGPDLEASNPGHPPPGEPL